MSIKEIIIEDGQKFEVKRVFTSESWRVEGIIDSWNGDGWNLVGMLDPVPSRFEEICLIFIKPIKNG